MEIASKASEADFDASYVDSHASDADTDASNVTPTIIQYFK